MSPTNAKALNTMRQRLRKHNLQYAEQMEKFRANPESEEEPDRLTLHQLHAIAASGTALSLRQCSKAPVLHLCARPARLGIIH